MLFFSICETIIVASLLIITSTLVLSQESEEPNLSQLLGLENCDQQIIHNGRHQSNFQHLQFLPTTIFDLGTVPNYTKKFWRLQSEVVQVPNSLRPISLIGCKPI